MPSCVESRQRAFGTASTTRSTTGARSAYIKNVSYDICLKSQETYPRSCAFTATTEAVSGPTTSDARPAAAAAGSKWPTFDFSDVHWIAVLPRSVDLHNARVAAPTYNDTRLCREK